MSKHAATLLPVLRELLTEADFPEKELDIFKQNSRQKLQVNLMKCDFVANRLIDATIYGEDHPYGRYSRFEDLDALTTATLRRFYAQAYGQGQVVVFMAGRMPAHIDELMQQAFGDLPWTPANHQYAPQPAAAFRADKKVQRISNDPNGVQGAIRLAQPFPSRSHPDYKAVQVLNLVFGGYFGSRLMSNIREDKGYTYGIHSYLQQQAGATAWMVATEAGRDVCEAAVAEVWKEMDLLRHELVDEDEMLLVRNYLLGALLGSLDGPFKSIGRWKGYILTGVDPEAYFYDHIATIKTISPERLQELAQTYLHPDRFYDMIVV
jgi:zinc protease